jgi:hypothetical protein
MSCGKVGLQNDNNHKKDSADNGLPVSAVIVAFSSSATVRPSRKTNTRILLYLFGKARAPIIGRRRTCRALKFNYCGFSVGRFGQLAASALTLSVSANRQGLLDSVCAKPTL